MAKMTYKEFRKRMKKLRKETETLTKHFIWLEVHQDFDYINGPRSSMEEALKHVKVASDAVEAGLD